MPPIKIAIVGLGKIARDQHLPSLAANPSFDLIAIASPHNQLVGTPSYQDVETLLREAPSVEAVAVCTTPQARYEIARYALEHGRHVLLEKPPGATVSEVTALCELASKNRLCLFASWHSRHARAVEPARAWLAGRNIHAATITWKEDVRVWHPGQPWIWKAGGLGVFDPGINALSILTRIIPGAIRLKSGELLFPRNSETPIAANLELAGPHAMPIRVELDFRQTGPQVWDIEIQSDGGLLRLSKGGTEMSVDDAPVPVPATAEYPNLYAHFAQLIRTRGIDVDCAPLQLAADAFLCGRRIEVALFVE